MTLSGVLTSFVDKAGLSQQIVAVQGFRVQVRSLVPFMKGRNWRAFKGRTGALDSSLRVHEHFSHLGLHLPIQNRDVLYIEHKEDAP